MSNEMPKEKLEQFEVNFVCFNREGEHQNTHHCASLWDASIRVVEIPIKDPDEPTPYDQ